MRKYMYFQMVIVAIFVIAVGTMLRGYSVRAETTCNNDLAHCLVTLREEHFKSLQQFSVPQFAEPSAMVSSQPRNVQSKTIVDYSVRSNGTIRADIDEFKAHADDTLNSDKGWARLGIFFNQVPSGGAFTLWLSEAVLMQNFSPSVCGADYSCQVGSDVIINQDRWLGATKSWNDAGGTLRDYQHMVINHEVGHWLGHDHTNCIAPGQPAPVMRQQSIDLQGCTFNPWPLDSELWASRLGI